MKKVVISIAISGCFVLPQMLFAQTCEQPQEVQVPDGSTASTEQMVEGQQAVKKYIAEGEAFLACMEEAEKANAEELTDEERLANVERYNTVVDQMQNLAQSFNEQIKAYKAAQAEQ